MSLQYEMVSTACPARFNLVCQIGTKMLNIQRNVTCRDYSSSKGKESRVITHKVQSIHLGSKKFKINICFISSALNNLVSLISIQI